MVEILLANSSNGTGKSRLSVIMKFPLTDSRGFPTPTEQQFRIRQQYQLMPQKEQRLIFVQSPVVSSDGLSILGDMQKSRYWILHHIPIRQCNGLYRTLRLAQVAASLPEASTAVMPIASSNPPVMMSLMSSSSRATLKMPTSSIMPLNRLFSLDAM